MGPIGLVVQKLIVLWFGVDFLRCEDLIRKNMTFMCKSILRRWW
jgi:hypothetical protein